MLSPSLFGAAARNYAQGTARSRSPSETMAVLLPLLPRFGVTRLANVTGLDRVGIPVYQAIRPNARSLSLSQGKGIDHDSAKVSAVMEALECHHAEHARCALRIESYRELARSERVADPMRLPLARVSEFSVDRQLPWVEARNVSDGLATFVPFELVHANATVPRVPGSGSFVFSTNGLASGNNLVEAVLHGACELIERDAEALFQTLNEAEQRRRRTTLTSVDSALARSLLDRFVHAGLDVALWDITSDLGIAAFRALIFDTESDPDLNPYPAAYGAGCHVERDIAVCRALSEAAQSRLTSIAGARDDLLRERYSELGRAELNVRFRALLSESAEHSFLAAPNFHAPTLDAELAHVAQQLRQRGLHDLLFVDLSGQDIDLRFVRVIAPGLEGPVQSPSYTRGERARRRAAAQ